MIETLGWLGTVLLLIGYWANSNLRHHLAMIMWIFGDIVWITYDVFIENWSHLALSSVIIIINTHGIYKIIRKQTQCTTENTHIEKL
jgi:hypothetical protein